MSATLTSHRIWQAFLGSHEDSRSFLHGHTYGGNPLAAAAAHATLDIFEMERTLKTLPAKAEVLRNGLNALRSHPEGESGPPLRIQSAAAQDALMHHAAAEDLHPSKTFSVAEIHFDVHLRSGLDERKIRRAEPHATRMAVESPRKFRQHGLEVDERNAVVDCEAFQLHEHRRVRCVKKVAAVDRTRRQHAHGWQL